MRLINSIKMKEKLFHNILNDLKNSCMVALIMEYPKLSYAKWHMKGLTIQLETMCQNDFMSKSTDEAWAFLEDLAEKDQQWNRFMSHPVSV